MDKQVRTDLFTHDMVHDNPGLVRYCSDYNNPKFLKARGYDGKTFDLSNCAQYGLLYDAVAKKYGKPEIFPEGSKARQWVLTRRAELKELYQKVADEGLSVSFMMDMIVFPVSLIQAFPEILNRQGKIDIALPMTKTLIEEMFDEMFKEFPQISGIYVRYGETYTGQDFGMPYHKGNNPILVTDNYDYHILLIKYLTEIVCNKYRRDVYYRTWAMWGTDSFQHNRETYLKITDTLPVNDRLYFCIKHTSGDFHRCTVFNQTLNCGKHNQIVEVQAAREFEGKGAYPNYIADGVINGFEEFKWVMPGEKPCCLRDVVNVKDSKIKGIWTWSRGGGWAGPYINGSNGKNGEIIVNEGKELWCDLNAYVISQWAKHTSKSDRFYVLKYAKEVLEMSEKDAMIFYEICLLSARGVLFGKCCYTNDLRWEIEWIRDQYVNVDFIDSNIKAALDAGKEEELMWWQNRAVEIWSDIVRLSKQITTGNSIDYIRVTCMYGSYLYSIAEKIYRANIYASKGYNVQDIIAEYDKLWEGWIKLKKENSCCPTLFQKQDERVDYLGLRTGFDSTIDKLRNK